MTATKAVEAMKAVGREVDVQLVRVKQVLMILVILMLILVILVILMMLIILMILAILKLILLRQVLVVTRGAARTMVRSSSTCLSTPTTRTTLSKQKVRQRIPQSKQPSQLRTIWSRRKKT